MCVSKAGAVVVVLFIWCYCCWPVTLVPFFCSQRDRVYVYACACVCLCWPHCCSPELNSCSILSFVCLFFSWFSFGCECEWKSECVFSWALAKCVYCQKQRGNSITGCRQRFAGVKFFFVVFKSCIDFCVHGISMLLFSHYLIDILTPF